MLPGLLLVKNPGWTLYKPWTGTIEIDGSDSCGLQEILLESVDRKVGLKVEGCVEDVITLSAPIVTPPQEGLEWRIGTITIDCGSLSNPITFDSAHHHWIDWLARHKYNGTGGGACVTINPQNAANGTIAFKHGKLTFLRSALFVGGDQTCAGVRFIPQAGEISTGEIDAGEIEGGHSGTVTYMSDGIQVYKPANGQNFCENRIKGFVTHFGGCALRVGLDSQSQNGKLEGQKWDVIAHAPIGTQAAGVSTWEKNGQYDLSLRGGNLNTGVNLCQGATGNGGFIRANDAGTKVQNGSGGSHYFTGQA